MINYEVQAKYTKESNDGTLQRVKDWYLLTAVVSFTDAETVVYAEVADGIRGAFSIEQIRKVEYEDIFANEDETMPWYKSKLSYKEENADSGKMKKASKTYMVQADTVDSATSILNDSLNGLFHEYEIESVTKTGIVELITDSVNKGE